jgi:hypothetical protein
MIHESRCFKSSSTRSEPRRSAATGRRPNLINAVRDDIPPLIATVKTMLAELEPQN